MQEIHSTLLIFGRFFLQSQNKEKHRNDKFLWSKQGTADLLKLTTPLSSLRGGQPIHTGSP